MKPIFVVDDNQDTLFVVDSILSKEGYDVECFHDWQELYEQLNYFSPSLILMDVYLGHADGRYIAAQLKGNKNTMNIPIILFSSDKHIAETSIEVFLPKPFTANNLINNIKNIIGSPNNLKD